MSLSLSDCLESLLSIREECKAHIKALDDIQRLVADLLRTQEAERVVAWQQAQESFQTNVTSIVLLHISRTVARAQAGGRMDRQDARSLIISLSLLQGLLFLHPPSGCLFERRGMLELLLAVLKLSPASTSTYHSATSQPEEQAELVSQTLSALLAALVDRPLNAQTFEQIGGLADIADLLRSQDLSPPVRYACLELIFFYLAPEQQAAYSASHVGAPIAGSALRNSMVMPSRTRPSENPLLQSTTSPSRKRLLSPERGDEEWGTPRRTRTQLDTPGSARPRLKAADPSEFGTPVTNSAPVILTKSPSEPTALSEVMVAETGGSLSTPNTPDRPRLSKRSNAIIAPSTPRLSSIMALPPRLPLSASPSAPQLLASAPARSRISLGGTKPFEPTVSALRKSSLSPGQASAGSHTLLGYSMPSPVSPSKRDSLVFTKENAPLSRSPSKRASLAGAGAVRGPKALGPSRLGRKSSDERHLVQVEELAEVFGNLGRVI